MADDPNTLGHMIISEDGAILSSGGEISNDEDIAEKLVSVTRTALKLHESDNRLKTTQFLRLSVIWEEFLYVITISNHKIHAYKRRNTMDDSDVVA